jgi:hypothetical protein
MKSNASPTRLEDLVSHLTFITRSALRKAIVLAAALAAVALSAPLAATASSRTAECQETPAHWISVTDDLGVPSLQLVSGTVCTNAVSTDACAAQRSPYPGWVQVTDDLGIPYLYEIGFEPASQTPCTQTNLAAASSSVAATPQSTLAPMKSPYAGWVVVLDDLGLPNLVPISQYR